MLVLEICHIIGVLGNWKTKVDLEERLTVPSRKIQTHGGQTTCHTVKYNICIICQEGFSIKELAYHKVIPKQLIEQINKLIVVYIESAAIVGVRCNKINYYVTGVIQYCL